MKWNPCTILRRLLPRTWIRRLAVGIVGAVLLYSIGGFLGVPLVLRHVVLAKLNAQLVGTLSVERIRFNPFSWVLQLQDFRALDPGGREAASFATFRLNLQPATLLGDTKVVREIFWDQPNCSVIIDAAGRLNLTSVFGLKERKPEPQHPEPLVLPALRIEHLEVRDAGLRLRMEALATPFEREVKQLSFVMRDLETDPGRDNPYRFELSTSVGETLTVEGALRFDPLSTTGHLSLASLSLPEFSAFGGSLTTAEIAGGELDMELDYHFRPLAQLPAFGIAEGRVEIRGLELVENGASLYRLELLQGVGLRLDIPGRSAGFDSLFIEGASILLRRSADGSLRLLAPSTTASGNPAAPAPSTAPAAPDKPLALGVVAADRDIGLPIDTARRQLRMLGSGGEGGSVSPLFIQLGTCTLRGSSLRVRDESIRPRLDLSVDGTELDAGPYDSAQDLPMPYSIKLKLPGDPGGALRAEGALLPLDLTAATRLKASASDIPLPLFAGYLAAAIGRPTTAGTLSGEMEVAIQGGAINAGNQLEIRGLAFGPRLEGTEAPQLPLELALAILEDRERVIHLNLPVKGDLKHPEFSTGGMISYAIRNVIEKVVTAPFSLLGGLLPETDGEVMDAVEFNPGRDQLPEGIDQQLQALAQVMNARPGLTLELTPCSSTRQDAQAWSELQFERKLAVLEGRGMDRKAAIKELHRDLPRDQRVPGLTFGKTDEMEAAVRESLAATAKDLNQLAERRAEAVKAALLKAGIGGERVVVKPPATGSRAVRFGLGVAR